MGLEPHSVVVNYSILLCKKDVQLEKVYCSSDAMIFCDASNIKRVIQNIVTNALDFAPQGSKIKIEIKETDSDVICVISDAGVGFSEEDIKCATDKFYMKDSSRTRKNHYGLGLAITERFIEEHGGKLSISNDKIMGGGRVSIIFLYSFFIIAFYYFQEQ